MKESTESPPYYIESKCRQQFDLTGVEPCYTFGNTIYNPFNNPLDEFQIAHESVHMVQQGEDPEGWWDKYLSDPKFRFEQELEAYRVQYRVVKEVVKDRNSAAKVLFVIARDLSSPMYGRMVTHTEAIKIIRAGIK